MEKKFSDGALREYRRVIMAAPSVSALYEWLDACPRQARLAVRLGAASPEMDAGATYDPAANEVVLFLSTGACPGGRPAGCLAPLLERKSALRGFARETAPAFLHEIAHAVQFCRFPGLLLLEPSFDAEYSAYAAELLYLLDELERDPAPLQDYLAGRPGRPGRLPPSACRPLLLASFDREEFKAAVRAEFASPTRVYRYRTLEEEHAAEKSRREDGRIAALATGRKEEAEASAERLVFIENSRKLLGREFEEWYGSKWDITAARALLLLGRASLKNGDRAAALKYLSRPLPETLPAGGRAAFAAALSEAK